MSGNLFPSTITIKAKTTTNVAGGATVSYAAAYSNVPAMIAPARASWMQFYQRRNISISHTIYTSTAIAVNTGDIVTYGSRQFVIRGTINIEETGRLYQLDCLEIQSTGELIEAK